MIGQIVWSVRLPRVVMALLAGGALGLCGATLQGVFQNPLVDPHIIGVTAAFPPLAARWRSCWASAVC